MVRLKTDSKVQEEANLKVLLARCVVFRVGVRDFRNFVAWQLSYQLECEVFEFTAIGPAPRNFKFRDQIRDSSASGHRNIAEGFGRFHPGEFARFCGYALGSLEETQSSLIDGRDRAYLDE
jgi:four helix bundle protein